MASEDVHHSKKFFASRKAASYHKPTCQFTKLGTNMISFDAPPVHLRPCSICHSQNEIRSILASRSASVTPESNHPRFDHDISFVSTQPDSSKIVDDPCVTDSSDIPTRYFMTQSGKLYHTDNTCLAFRRAAKEIFEVRARPKSLSPCPYCVKGCAHPESVQTDVLTPVSPGHAKPNDSQPDELSQTGLTPPLKSKADVENMSSVSGTAENEKEVTIDSNNPFADKSVTFSDDEVHAKTPDRKTKNSNLEHEQESHTVAVNSSPMTPRTKMSEAPGVQSITNEKPGFLATTSGSNFHHLNESCENVDHDRDATHVSKPAQGKVPCNICVNSTQSPSFESPKFSSSFKAETLPSSFSKFGDGLPASFASSVSPTDLSFASGSSSSQTPAPASPVTPARENAHTFGSSVTTSGDQSQNSDASSAASADVSSIEYYTTRTGVFYHQNRDCHNLRSARRIFPTETPSSHLRSCYLCVDDPYQGPTSQRSFDATSLSGTTYVTTRTGRFYHEDYNCTFLELARQKFRVREVPARLDPCYRCVVTPVPVQRG